MGLAGKILFVSYVLLMAMQLVGTASVKTKRSILTDLGNIFRSPQNSRGQTGSYDTDVETSDTQSLPPEIVSDEPVDEFGDPTDSDVAKPSREDLGLGLSLADENSVSEPKAIKEDLDRIRLEIIKHQILSKLRMTSRPNTTYPKERLPTPISEREFAPHYQATSSKPNRDMDEYYGQTTKVIVFASEVSGNCYNAINKPIGCFHFDLKDKLDGKSVHSANLYVYKLRDPGDMHNQTIVVKEITNPNHSKYKSDKIIGTLDTPKKRGWLTYDIKDTLSYWLRRPSRNRGIEVICKTCRLDGTVSPVDVTAGHRPFIVVDTEKKSSYRYKRSVDCSPGSTVCCRQQFYVSFRQLGWHDWVLQPAGYHANYCKGSCVDPTGITTYHHTSVMHGVGVSDSVDAAVKAELTPCCSPTKMSGLSLLYYDDDNYILKKNLPNMIVESCGCS